jgi:hypothetical protein
MTMLRAAAVQAAPVLMDRSVDTAPRLALSEMALADDLDR